MFAYIGANSLQLLQWQSAHEGAPTNGVPSNQHKVCHGDTANYYLVLALVLGAAIGAERQFRMHPAGLHTNSLVSLGSAAFVMVSVLTHQQAFGVCVQ